MESVRFYMVTCVGNLGYKDLCMQGRKSIPERRKILAEKLENLRKEQEKSSQHRLHPLEKQSLQRHRKRKSPLQKFPSQKSGQGISFIDFVEKSHQR